MISLPINLTTQYAVIIAPVFMLSDMKGALNLLANLQRFHLTMNSEYDLYLCDFQSLLFLMCAENLKVMRSPTTVS